MKLSLFTILFFYSCFIFSQNHNFIIDNKHVIWEKTYPTFKKDIIQLLVKNNKKINSFSDSNKGAVNNATCDCSLSGFIGYRTYDFLFDISITESNYTIVVYNITLDVDSELDFADENTPIEQLILNYSRTKFYNSKKNEANLECLSSFLYKNFELPFD